MMTLIRAFHAETLKLKRTLALWLVAIAPLAVLLLIVASYWQRRESILSDSARMWEFLAQQTFIFWALLMLPLFITLETALLGGLEHESDHWKQILAQPVSRAAIYLAKQFIALLLIGLSMLALAGFTCLAGVGLQIALPEMIVNCGIPWGDLLRYAGCAFLASWLIISLHTWVGLRWRNFVVAMSVGIVLTVAGVLVINSDFGAYYPWSAPGMAISKLNEGNSPMTQVWVGLIGGPLVMLLGAWDVARRDVL